MTTAEKILLYRALARLMKLRAEGLLSTARRQHVRLHPSRVSLGGLSDMAIAAGIVDEDGLVTEKGKDFFENANYCFARIITKTKGVFMIGMQELARIRAFFPNSEITVYAVGDGYYLYASEVPFDETAPGGIPLWSGFKAKMRDELEVFIPSGNNPAIHALYKFKEHE